MTQGIKTLVLWLALTGCLGVAACKPPTDKGIVSQYEPLNVRSARGVHEFQVEIADDAGERAKGLMNRQSLAPGQGMLFEFPDIAERAFWMKDTYIPLDIIYISPSGRIISIQKNTVPLSEAQLPSYGAAKGVLEIQGGLSDRLGIGPGDQIIHPFFDIRP